MRKRFTTDDDVESISNLKAQRENVSSSYLNAPWFSWWRSKAFNRSFWFVINFGRVNWYGKGSNDQINERKPKIKAVCEGHLFYTVKLKFIKERLTLISRTHSMLFSNCTQMKNKLLDTDKIVMNEILSSTFITRSHTLR